MSDLICRKSMARCLTPGMCSPHGGCQPDKTEWQSGYDEGRRMGTKHMYAEVDRLKAENEALRDHLRLRVSAMPRDRLRETFNAAYYGPRELGSDGEQCRAGVIAVIDSAMGKGEQS